MSGPDENRSAGVPPAVTGASRTRPGEVTIRSRGHLPLPHWESEGGTYFVTFRVDGSVPEELVRDLDRRKKPPIKLLGDKRPSVKEVEAYLDRCDDECHLRNPVAAEIVANAIQHLDSKDYRLLAWVAMPNHVHPVFKMLPGKSLSRTLRSLKSFTAKQVNKVLWENRNTLAA